MSPKKLLNAISRYLIWSFEIEYATYEKSDTAQHTNINKL